MGCIPSELACIPSELACIPSELACIPLSWPVRRVCKLPVFFFSNTEKKVSAFGNLFQIICISNHWLTRLRNNFKII